MDCIRIVADFAFPLDERGDLTAETQTIHDALLDLLAKAKSLAVDVTDHEITTSATRHLCRHAAGKPCDEAEEITDDARCVADARAAIGAVGVEPVKVGR